MSFRNSIRWRLQAWHGAFLGLVIAGLCFTVYQFYKAEALRLLDFNLNLRLGVLSAALTQDGNEDERPPQEQEQGERESDFPEDDAPPPPRRGGAPRPGQAPPGFRSKAVTSLFSDPSGESFYYQVWTRHNDVLDRSATTPFEVPPPDGMERSFPGNGLRERDGYREVYHFTPPGECLLVGRSMIGLGVELRGVAWKLTGMGLAVFAVGLAGGAWISGRALRPIADISAAASRIAAGNLKERIRTHETKSELGKLATLLDETFQRLDAVFEEQSRFTSDAAHELRTPVSIILAHSQLALSKDRSAEVYRETIEVSQRAAKRMHGLIESLLQLAILEASPGGRISEPCDLAEVGAEQVRLLEPLAKEKEIALQTVLTPALCAANPDQIAQIAMNLLTNAIKYCPQGTEVIVATRVTAGKAVLTVADNGPGIAPEHLPHLFERFYRTDASRNRASGGAGLGLAICRRIAEAHGGSLEVTSKVGKGSIFTLTIPV